MQTKPTTNAEARASGLDMVDVCDRAIAIHNASMNVLSAVEVMSRYVLDTLEQSAEGFFPKGVVSNALKGSLFYITSEHQRRLLYLVAEAEDRAGNLLELTETESDFWCDFRSAQISDASKPVDGLEEVIQGWQAAHAKWLERLDKDDDVAVPESIADNRASEALMGFQCCTHEEVQRKVKLFTATDHLATLGSRNIDVFLPSLIIPEGGEA